MSEGESKETKPEGSPPGTGSEPGDSAPPAKVWLPPRLRDRLEGADEPPPKGTADIGGWIAMLLVVALAAGVVWWVGQRRKAEKVAEAKRLEEVRLAAVAESLAQVRAADSLKQVARADSAKAFLALPLWKQKMILAGTAGADGGGGGPNLDETGRFAIDAATFAFEEPAQEAAENLKAATKLSARVVPVERDGSTTYHVYLGNFTQRGAAAFAADQILERGSAPMARVVKLD